jgi:hypothetical protein
VDIKVDRSYANVFFRFFLVPRLLHLSIHIRLTFLMMRDCIIIIIIIRLAYYLFKLLTNSNALIIASNHFECSIVTLSLHFKNYLVAEV